MLLGKGDGRAIVLVAAMGLVLGAIPAYLGGSMLYERFAYGSAGSPASGEVIEAERLWLRELLMTPFSKRKLWRLTYEFKAKGEAVRSSSLYFQSRALTDARPGYKVRVLYLADDPSSSYLDDNHKAWAGAGYLGVGLFVWFVVGAFVWWEIRQARRQAR